MYIEDLRDYCKSLKGVTEDFPFDESTLAFRVMEKIFALMNIYSEDLSINLKCDPERAIELREHHPDITPGFHMNKKHWNTVRCEGELQNDLIRELIDHSYELIVNKLPKTKRNELENM